MEAKAILAKFDLLDDDALEGPLVFLADLALFPKSPPWRTQGIRL